MKLLNLSDLANERTVWVAGATEQLDRDVLNHSCSYIATLYWRSTISVWVGGDRMGHCIAQHVGLNSDHIQSELRCQISLLFRTT